jgi:hypothetical protein
MAIEPTNEAETIALYQAAQDRLRWRIVHLQTAFPDAVIENGQGKQLIAEFEHKARNFGYHGHDPTGCDLIICWRNNWPDAPLPVWALDECPQVVGAMWPNWVDDLVENLREENKQLKLELREARIELWRINRDNDTEMELLYSVHETRGGDLELTAAMVPKAQVTKRGAKFDLTAILDDV